jgi:diguanylate cyclase (GGDEF)-like protein
VKAAWQEEVAALAREADLEARRRQAAARLKLLMRAVGSLGWTTDADLRLVTCAGSGLADLEVAPEQLIGRSLEDVLPPGEDGREALMAHARALEGETADYESDWLGHRWQVHVEPLPDRAGRPAGTVGAALDVTRLRDLEREITEASQRDGLTGLPGRVAFLERLARPVAHGGRFSGGYAVLLVNLDGFKTVNDSLGHAAGDVLLREVARRIVGTLRAGDMAARFGGDEFTILLEDLDGTEPSRVADRVLRVLSAPVEASGRQIALQASIGIALAGRDQPPEEVLRNAEIAMFQAKARGKSRFEVFDRPLDARSVSLLRVEVELRRALEREEFRTHYAPTVAVKGGKVSGFEVLLWRRSAAARR